MKAAEGSPGIGEVELTRPLRLKTPSRIGVQFMGDLFHEKIPGGWIADVFNQMLKCGYEDRHHDFFVLTKRPKRVKWFFDEATARNCIHGGLPVSSSDKLSGGIPAHIWMGTSCENQRWTDSRIPDLFAATQAASHWVSFEPLLGPIDVTEYIKVYGAHRKQCKSESEACPNEACSCPQIDWAVIGCESGLHRRPCKIEWMVDLVGQLRDAGVPVFVKQVEINGRVEIQPRMFPKELQHREIVRRGI